MGVGSEHAYSGRDNLEVMRAAKNYNRHVAGLVLRSRGRAAAAVDFGAGDGTMTELVRQGGLDVCCVEQDPVLAQGLETMGFVVFPSLGELPTKSADYVYSLNVLEHIEDDSAILRDLSALLRSGGRLMLYVPAFMVLYSSLDKKVKHFRRYRRGQLERLCEDAGFRVLRSDYVDSLGFLAAVLFRVFGNRHGGINPVGLSVFDRFVFPCSRVIDRVSSPVFGKNLLVVAVRR